MERDFLKELEFLGVTARLKRLSDNLSYSIKDLYQQKDLDIEPSWHLVILLLKKQESSTMSEIADLLQLSQAAATKMLNKMIQKGYLISVRDEKDNRKKMIQLSDKAKLELPKFEKVWNAGQSSIRDILQSNTDFLNNLSDFEDKLKEKSFQQRALEHL
ncbi:MarR family winged helix-turn-helix transcriptional regulator [Marinifilum caeruleilacunae]|uniref:MarR family transcriptional regulator n=1 Tax=Marinifilum caeruleilacunae TaxID=2499076 RepID=A0ABX1WT04_9BACT|nr:MarR family transcriptional regulator [Marinifilum caeruleilacunae]NOU59122.1 MarR family transcriptional regulator [Marinifilum caeruleilacunae]